MGVQRAPVSRRLEEAFMEQKAAVMEVVKEPEVGLAVLSVGKEPEGGSLVLSGRHCRVLGCWG